MSPPRSFLVCIKWFGLAGGLVSGFSHFLSLSHSLPGSKRVTRVAGAGCHSVGVAAAEDEGLEVKQVCWLAGFEVIST